jgi:hypothetical protein
MSSFRTATHTAWSHQHVGSLFVGAILDFWIIALLCHRAASDDEHIDGDIVRGTDAVLIR